MRRGTQRTFAVFCLSLTVAILAYVLLCDPGAMDRPAPSSVGGEVTAARDAPEAVASDSSAEGGSSAQELVPRRQAMADAAVTVVDSSGQTVQGVTVIAIAQTSQRKQLIHEARTGSDGIAHFTLPPISPLWYVLANGDGTDSGRRSHDHLSRGYGELRSDSPYGLQCRIELSRLEARLEVLVVDDSSAPVAGVIVSPRHEGQEQTTDSAGIARFDKLPAGDRRIFVQPGSGTRSDVAFASDLSQSTFLEANKTTFLTFEIPRLATLELRLEGQGLDCAALIDVLSLSAGGGLRRNVSIEPSAPKKVEGLPPGEYMVAARFASDSPWDASSWEHVVLRAGERRLHVVRARRLTGVLRGHVLDHAMQPVVGAVVCARTPTRVPAKAPSVEKWAVTDEAGGFSIMGLASGTAEFSVRVERIVDRDFQFLGGDLEWISIPCPDESVLIRLQRSPSVRGRVVNERGAPVSNQTVSLQREGAPYDRRANTSSGDVADDDAAAGTFQFRHVKPGKYRLWVEVEGRRIEREFVVGDWTGEPADLYEVVIPGR